MTADERGTIAADEWWAFGRQLGDYPGAPALAIIISKYLRAHESDVLERAAKVADERFAGVNFVCDPINSRWTANQVAAAIRKLKEKS